MGCTITWTVSVPAGTTTRGSLYAAALAGSAACGWPTTADAAAICVRLLSLALEKEMMMLKQLAVGVLIVAILAGCQSETDLAISPVEATPNVPTLRIPFEKYTLENGEKTGFDFEQAYASIAHSNPKKQEEGNE